MIESSHRFAKHPSSEPEKDPKNFELTPDNQEVVLGFIMEALKGPTQQLVFTPKSVTLEQRNKYDALRKIATDLIIHSGREIPFGEAIERGLIDLVSDEMLSIVARMDTARNPDRIMQIYLSRHFLQEKMNNATKHAVNANPKFPNQ